MASIIDALIGPLWPWIMAALSAAGVALYGRSKRKQGQQKERAENLAKKVANEREAHDRINKAPTGGGMSDDQRREWLRDIADKWGGS